MNNYQDAPAGASFLNCEKDILENYAVDLELFNNLWKYVIIVANTLIKKLDPEKFKKAERE